MKQDISNKGIWAISYPIIISLFAQNIIGVVDTAFLGRLGEVELGASAIAGLIYVAFYMIGFGLATGVQIVISRRNGEQQWKEVGMVWKQGIYIQLFLSLAVCFIMTFLIPLSLNIFLESREITNAATDFLQVRSWGIVPAMIAALYRSFFIGITNTKHLTISAFLIALLNIVLDYLLIFGHFGFPAMGIQGAALASVISEAGGLLYLIIVTVHKKEFEVYFLYKKNPFIKVEALKILNISYPVMLQYFISLSAWLIFFMLIEKMGQHDLAISNIIRSIYLFLMIPGWAFTSATSSITGNLLGENRIREIKTMIFKIIKLNFSSSFLLSLLVVVFAKNILMLYTDDIILIDDSVQPLFIVAASMLLFSVSMIYFSVITGSGNTRTALLIEISTIVLYLFYTWFLVNVLKQSIAVVWTAEWFYFFVIGLFAIIYLLKTKWYLKKV